MPWCVKKKKVDADTQYKLDAAYRRVHNTTDYECHSLLKKYLTIEVFNRLKSLKTPSDATLLDVIQSGVRNLNADCGIYAPDADSYTVFADLFDPIIAEHFDGFYKKDKHPHLDFGDVNAIVNLDTTGTFIQSCQIECCRSIQGYPFSPIMTENQYKDVESFVSNTLKTLTGEMQGSYTPLLGLTDAAKLNLTLFKQSDRFLEAANACRFWPIGRGLFHNNTKDFLVWVNEEDHLWIISLQQGGDLGTAYKRLVAGLIQLGKKLPFVHSERLGFLTFCPTNLGTTMKVSVYIKLPKLHEDKIQFDANALKEFTHKLPKMNPDKSQFDTILDKYSLQVESGPQKNGPQKGVMVISNKRLLGLTEFQTVKDFQDAILELIKLEQSL